jgi:hypothetical protein
MSVIVRECRLRLLADSETGRRYCFSLDNPYTGESILLSAPDRDTFDMWVNMIMPVSNQELAASSDDDLALLNRNQSIGELQDQDDLSDPEIYSPTVEEPQQTVHSSPSKYSIRRQIGDWREYVDALGNRYFENTRTKKTTQDVPREFR